MPTLHESQLNPDTISSQVARLRETVCDLWGTLEMMVGKSKGRGKFKGIAIKALKGIAGAGIISVNATTDAVTLGPWVTPLSGAVGSALISKSIG